MATKTSSQGYVILLLSVFLMVLSYLWKPYTNNKITSEKNNIKQMIIVKKILLDYAFSFPFSESSSGNYRFGFFPVLPCPDVGRSNQSDGSQAGTCGSVNVASLGRVPWKSLNIKRPLNAVGECLLYLVAGNAKRNDPRQTKTHFNTDADQWIYYKNNSAVAALVFPNKTVNNKAKETFYFCRDDYDFSKLFTNASLFEKTDQVISLDNLKDVQILLIKKEEVFSPKFLNLYWLPLAKKTGLALAHCIADFSVFDSINQKWLIPQPLPLNIKDDRATNYYDSKNSSENSGLFPVKHTTFDLSLDCKSNRLTNKYKIEDKKNPYYRFWLATKNQWFLTIKPSCQSVNSCYNHKSNQIIAMVVFANTRTTNQSRFSKRFDSADRTKLSNFIEGNTLDIFLQSELKIKEGTGNDLRFCITKNKTVLEC